MSGIRETRHAEIQETDDGDIKVNQYLIKESIGKGAYGIVSLAVDTTSGIEYAMKEFSKSRLRRKNRSAMMRPAGQGGIRGKRSNFSIRARNINSGEAEDSMDLIKGEMAILKKLNHNNIVKLYEVLDSDNDDVLYMVFEMCHKGPIQDVKLSGKFDSYGEEESRKYFRDLLLGVEYLHENGIAHRDLKPDNILLLNDGTLKIADFGVSEIFQGDDKITGSAGSPAFMAPELLEASQKEYHAKAIDIWAVGVILYCLNFGTLPFLGVNVLEIRDAIVTQDFIVPDDTNPELKDLLTRLLCKDPQQRITMDELRVHPWVTEDGKNLMSSFEENTKHVVQEITDDDIRCAIKGFGSIITVVKAVNRFKNLRKSVHSDDGSV